MTFKFLATFILSIVAFLGANNLPINWLDRWPRLWLRLSCAFAILPVLPFEGVEMGETCRLLALDNLVGTSC